MASEYYLQNYLIVCKVRKFHWAGTNILRRARNNTKVEAEQAYVRCLVTEAANADARTGTVDEPAIARIRGRRAACRRWHKERKRIVNGCYTECARIAVPRAADADTICTVTEFRRVENNAKSCGGVITSVDPIVHVIPKSFNISVLRSEAISRAGRLRRTRMIRH